MLSIMATLGFISERNKKILRDFCAVSKQKIRFLLDKVAIITCPKAKSKEVTREVRLVTKYFSLQFPQLKRDILDIVLTIEESSND
jgi:hypothetical protein